MCAVVPTSRGQASAVASPGGGERAESGRRLRILYLVPGHHLLPSVGPSRNVLSLARALAGLPGVEVAVAFRRVLEALPAGDLEVLELEPQGQLPADLRDDAAMRGIGAAEALHYLRTLHGFVRTHVARFDLVLEKGWLFSGWLSRLVAHAGRVGVPVENFVPDPGRHAHGDLARRLRLELGLRLARYCLRRAPLVIAETEALKRSLVAVCGLIPERVAVIGVGLDRRLFRPRPQEEARARFGIPQNAMVWLYVGVLDATHDLWPVLQALAAAEPAQRPQLHVVGEGIMRPAYEAFVRERDLPVRFHGRRPHGEVPQWIAAADLCLAPYDPRVFAGGELAYSTLKVREYLACGRPVATVASGVLRELVRHGESGFLLDHDETAWRALLAAAPDRGVLARMGAAAASTPIPDWDEVARRYLDHCLPLLARSAETARR